MAVVDVWLRPNGQKLGFYLSLNEQNQLVVDQVDTDGVAHEKVRPGDQLLFINDTRVVSWQPSQVVQLIKSNNAEHLKLTINRSTMSPSIVPLASGKLSTEEKTSEHTSIVRLQLIPQYDGYPGFEVVASGSDEYRHQISAVDSTLTDCLEPGDILLSLNSMRCDVSAIEAVKYMLNHYVKANEPLRLAFVRRSNLAMKPVSRPDTALLSSLQYGRCIFRHPATGSPGFEMSILPYELDDGRTPNALAQVTQVDVNSEAFRCGLKPGQIVLAANNVPLSSVTQDDLEAVLSWLGSNQLVNLVVGWLHAPDALGFEAVLTRRNKSDRLGLHLTDRLPQLYTETGVFIETATIDPQQGGSKVNLIENGMLICAINGKSILNWSYEEVLDELSATEGEVRLWLARAMWPDKPQGPLDTIAEVAPAAKRTSIIAMPRDPTHQTTELESHAELLREAATLLQQMQFKDENGAHVVEHAIPGARLKAGDAILWIDDACVLAWSAETIRGHIQRLHNGDVLVVRVPAEAVGRKTYKAVKVERGGEPFGASLAGGVLPLQPNIYIQAIKPASVADRAGEFTPGDIILAVDSTLLVNRSHQDAVNAFRAATNKMTVLVEKEAKTA
ncbi:uncharacterized protein MONBRDRAFT_36633 [Monosiga brevicollis MX1]|uniref:PDZ domain-containing protein n=1 Tax=Monosiga brevicollis TaxID=81824 RepID=A9UWH8_MONBE|nr:uncharacterized protein MONBRDRAFT_36633 [Monosiga brevicollis MX1]EDQ90216.1 predicted protein [Monosiga brevicollis MX1]|eukprot:XP_001744983.1 hypothetical protein [Monosiga brevicollis MX1]